ncbi:putative mitochondrial protein [Tanacetum coccineum]
MKLMYPLQVSIANEEAMSSTLMCQGLSMTIGEVTYVIDAMVLPLGACDMVLGIEWLVTLRDIQFYFKKLTMVFYVGNQKFKGYNIDSETINDTVLDEFKGVFEVPTSLPPKRSHDHYSPLMPNIPLVYIRPHKLCMLTPCLQRGLKEAMIPALLLGFPNFEREFTMETDACGTGIGVILLQDGHCLAYLSKALSPKHQALSTYEKEFLAVILALEK